ncbi:MAG: hypothetical protein K6B70_02640 [Clostridia bacterium]|nr:hypothetical protein [Clostridia bacterium]
MKNKIIKIFSVISAFMLNCMTFVYAENGEKIYDDFGIYDIGDAARSNTGIMGAGRYISGWILYAGIIICVIALMIKGIKFITAAPEGKAEVKKSLLPWIIGLIILLVGRVALNWILNLALGINRMSV